MSVAGHTELVNMCTRTSNDVALAALVTMALLLGSRAPAARAAEELSEEQKIKSLIGTIEALSDAKFIRNGKEYDCKAAAEHVRRKWNAVKDRITSARQFVTAVASRSERSGQAYRIRFKDGAEQTSEAFLTGKLDEIEGKDGDDKKKFIQWE